MGKLDDIRNKSEVQTKIIKQNKTTQEKNIAKQEYTKSIESNNNNNDGTYVLGFIDYSINSIKSNDMNMLHLLLGCQAFDSIVNNQIEGIVYNPPEEKHLINVNKYTQSNYFILNSNYYIKIMYLSLMSHSSKLAGNKELQLTSSLFIELDHDGKHILVIPNILESIETFGYRFTDIVLTIASLGYKLNLDSYDEIHVVDINNIRYSVDIYKSIDELDYVSINAHNSSAELDSDNNQISINIQSHCNECMMKSICKENSILKIK